jgi:hypothetical protein
MHWRREASDAVPERDFASGEQLLAAVDDRGENPGDGRLKAMLPARKHLIGRNMGVSRGPCLVINR